MKKILHLTVFLALISAIAGGALAAVNAVTAPIIEESAIASEKANLELIYPGADFKAVELSGDTGSIIGAYEAAGKGMIYKVSVTGFKDSLIYLVAIGENGNFDGYKVLQNNDTSGFGRRVSDAEFYDQFVGKPIDTKIDTLSGATVSSTATVNGLKEVVEYYNATK